MVLIRLQPTVRARLVAEAAWELVLRDGRIGGLTRERVARAAACSTGSVSSGKTMPELLAALARRAKREQRWDLLRDALPGGKCEGAVRLTRVEVQLVLNATILRTKR